MYIYMYIYKNDETFKISLYFDSYKIVRIEI